MCCNNVLLANGAQGPDGGGAPGTTCWSTPAGRSTHDLAVIGPVEVELRARRRARDTDFTAKLVDVHLRRGLTGNVLDRIVPGSLPPGFEACRPR